MTLIDFLLARYAELEAVARAVEADNFDQGPISTGDDPWPSERAFAEHFTPAYVLADLEAKRRIVELHKSWPVLVQTPPTFEPVESTDPSQFAMRASQQVMWLTEQEYRVKFGDEPPTAPMLRALALPFADHPDYRAEEWAP